MWKGFRSGAHDRPFKSSRVAVHRGKGYGKVGTTRKKSTDRGSCCFTIFRPWQLVGAW